VNLVAERDPFRRIYSMQPEAKLLSGKYALVTGAGRNIGRGIAMTLAAQGCNVVINFKEESDRHEAEGTLAALQRLGVQALTIEGDVSQGSSVVSMFDELANRIPRLDVLVNNAGIQVWRALLEMSEEDWESVMATNARGCFNCTQAAARMMKQHGGGSIVNIGSGCSKVAFPRLVSYAASKGAIDMLTKEAAVELGPMNIRVNCVAPGSILSARTLIEDPAYEAKWSRITPLRRVGTPEDVGGAVVYFASDLSTFVTGQTIWVDGGVFTQAPWPYELKDS
jgi:3-oxoacyl-[acyl-carrier protein] reductase